MVAGDLNGVNGKTNRSNGIMIPMNQMNQVNGHSNGTYIPGIIIQIKRWQKGK